MCHRDIYSNGNNLPGAGTDMYGDKSMPHNPCCDAMKVATVPPQHGPSPATIFQRVLLDDREPAVLLECLECAIGRRLRVGDVLVFRTPIQAASFRQTPNCDPCYLALNGNRFAIFITASQSDVFNASVKNFASSALPGQAR